MRNTVTFWAGVAGGLGGIAAVVTLVIEVAGPAFSDGHSAPLTDKPLSGATQEEVKSLPHDVESDAVIVAPPVTISESGVPDTEAKPADETVGPPFRVYEGRSTSTCGGVRLQVDEIWVDAIGNPENIVLVSWSVPGEAKRREKRLNGVGSAVTLVESCDLLLVRSGVGVNGKFARFQLRSPSKAPPAR